MAKRKDNPRVSLNRDCPMHGRFLTCRCADKDLSHVPCKFFKVGSCTAGPSCPFSHSTSEPGQQKQVCTWFVKGSCKFGHKCALAHILPGQPMNMDRKNKKAAQQTAAATGQSTPTPPKSGSDKPPRTQRSHHHSSSKENTASTSSSGLRPSFASISKGPGAISASVPAPPVLRDTSADYAFDFPEDMDHRSKSKSPRSTLHPSLPAQVQLQQQQLRQQHTGNTATPPTSTTHLHPSQDPASRTPQLNHVNLEDHRPSPTRLNDTPGPRRPSPLPLSPSMSATRINRSSDFGFGPVGSPPRAGLLHQASGLTNQRTNASNNGPGVLSNLLAGLTLNNTSGSVGGSNLTPGGPTSGFTPSASPSRNMNPMDGISTSLASATNTFGTSPFSAPGSKSLFMPYGDSNSAATGSPLKNQFSNGGYPASFAGSRGFAWDTQTSRRPSLPGQNPMGHDWAASASLLLDESAVEEDFEAEEFLPSSLNELLTTEERERRMSRTGGAMRSGSALRNEASNGEWNGGNRLMTRPNVEAHHSPYSRSVPAQSLMNNVKAIWDNGATSPGMGEGMGSQVGLGRGFSSNGQRLAQTSEELFHSGNELSPSLLSTSNVSNASNAFLQSGVTRVQQSNGGIGRFGGAPGVLSNTSGLTSPIDNNFTSSTSYNPQTGGLSQMNQHFQPSQLSNSLYPSSQNDSSSSAFYGLHQPHPSHHRPANAPGGGGLNGGMNMVSPTTRAMRSHAHEPGSSLPRGLGAGLSRLHLVPTSLTMNSIGSPTPEYTSTNSPGYTPASSFAGTTATSGNTGSPSYASTLATSKQWDTSSTSLKGNYSSNLASANPISSSFSNRSMFMDSNETDTTTLSTTPTKNIGLAARLAAPSGGTTATFGMSQPGVVAPVLPVPPTTALNTKRNVWGTGAGSSPASRPHEDDRDVDEDPMFSLEY